MEKITPYLGVIEGFFGRTWSMQERHDYGEFLQASGYHFYIYAPKNDPYLRKSWQHHWSPETTDQLQSLIRHYQSLGLDYGLGLSPFEIYKNYNAKAQQQLLDKVERLDELGIDSLCLLFDDMRGDQPDLAQTQVKIVKDVLAHTSVKKIIMCPTYYSFDPRLEKVFGSMPKHYFQDLGEGLPAEIDIFWTGPEICSKEYPESHMEKVIQVLGRKPFLWDNYPVNDGADISKFLHLKAFENRPHTLAQQTTGHAVNPMNQSWLSRIPLHSLPQSYSQGDQYDPEKVLKESLIELCGDTLSNQILKNIESLQVHGLDKIDAAESKHLIQEYSRFNSGCAREYAKEIIAWLKGEYEFDKACLTG